MKKPNLLIIPIIIAFIMSSCGGGDCEGLGNDAHDRAGAAARRLLSRKLPESERLTVINVEERGNCQFLVTFKSHKSGTLRPDKRLEARVQYDGAEFYLLN
jgi:hypothetical protein